MARYFDEDFERALAGLEDAVLAAVVPGEAELWCRSAREAVAAMEGGLRDNLRRHAELFSEVEGERPELSSHLRELRRRDVELTEGLAGLGKELERTIERCAPPDASDEPLAHVKVLRLRLLEWLQRAKLQEAELITWLFEAAYRELGEGD